MATLKLPNPTVPIVDPKTGLPTKEFVQQWSELVRQVITLS